MKALKVMRFILYAAEIMQFCLGNGWVAEVEDVCADGLGAQVVVHDAFDDDGQLDLEVGLASLDENVAGPADQIAELKMNEN